ncbi:MAG TPA: InlB B-repeat-containing protein, partial [Spirochaetota bacterium]|nr:InlB B-repeat-containing protein [Spirochaetota bacterium]
MKSIALSVLALAFGIFSCVSVDDTAEIFKISFDKNDAAATGTMMQQEVTSGTTATLLKCTFAKTGWRFAGWAASADGAVAYADQAAYKMGTGNVTLFAKWTINTNQVAFDKNDA